jgi:hypothetical protein
MPRDPRAPQRASGEAAGRNAAGKSEKIIRRNERRRARNEDNPGQGEAGTRHIDSPRESDRGPVGVKGRSAPGQSRPGRR